MKPVCENTSQCKAENNKPQVKYYRPDVNIYESADEFVLVADIPGSSAESIDLSFESGKLAIKAKAAARNSEDSKMLLMEYGIADFYRSFEVNEPIDVDSTSASYKDGVLTVNLKKLHSAGQRKIQITTSH